MRKFIPVFVCCAFLIISIPRLLSLDAHWNSDEARWLQRSENFMSAVKQGKFSDTLVSYHPGVMTMWIAGLRTFFLDAGINLQNLIRARWFLGVAVWIGIGVSGLLLYHIFGRWEAITSIVFLVFSPFFLAQTRRVHTDALAAIFVLLTVLLLLLYCKNWQKHRYLVLSGITYGLAVLSKSYSLILIVWVPICLFLFWGHREKVLKKLFRAIAAALCFLSCGVLTIIGLWPVFWEPAFGLLAASLLGVTVLLLNTLKKDNEQKWISLLLLLTTGIVLVVVSTNAIRVLWLILDRVNWAVTTPHEVEHFFLGKVVYDPGWLFYWFVLSIKSTPLMLPLVFVCAFLFWTRRKTSVETGLQFRRVIALIVVVLLFTLCLSITSKKFSRYLLPAFPILEILAAFGFVGFIRWSVSQIQSRFGNGTNSIGATFTYIACICYFLIQILPVLLLHPYYGTYYNLCWKVTDITKVITVGEASGLDIAAKYLNAKPNADQMIVQVSPLATEFIGRYFRGYAYRADRNIGRIANYEIVYIRDSQIGRVPQTGTLNGALEAIITLNGIDHVWIYQVQGMKAN